RLVQRLKAEEHYEVDEAKRTIAVSEEGIARVEQLLSIDNLYDQVHTPLVHYLESALKAKELYKRDRDYIVQNREVLIVDEFTGRTLPGRRWSDGLHQAVEAKESVPIQQENQTLATITIQNYFRLYEKLAGMTGTAKTQATEFANVYGLEVFEVPTNRPNIRKDESDSIYKSEDAKWKAVTDDVVTRHGAGQPVLVGTISIEKSERLAGYLARRGVEHHILNAKHHEKEAYIVAQAGRTGAVTLATNMAGRGVDILLGGNPEYLARAEMSARGWDNDAYLLEQLSEEDRAAYEAEYEPILEAKKAECADEHERVVAAGGLYILGTERHESRRIDNQLRGRSGRQGDPGHSKFFLSLEDDLMRIFGSDKLDTMLQRLGLKENEAIVHSWINKALEKAQQKVEARNFDIRKNLLKFDNVMNDQRKVIFDQRVEWMRGDTSAEIVADMRHATIEELVAKHVPENAYPEQWHTAELKEELKRVLGLDLPVDEWAKEEGIADEELLTRIERRADEHMAAKVAQWGTDVMRYVEKSILLQTLDHLWREHLVTLEHLRQVIGLRGYGQRDPLNEYKAESFNLFEAMGKNLREMVTAQLMRLEIVTQPPPDAQQLPYMEAHHLDPSTGEDELALARAGAETLARHGFAASPEPERNP